MLRFTTAGESHGPCLVVVIEGLPAGLNISLPAINRDLARRQGGYGRGDRMKIEQDQVEILGGVVDGRTIGAPVALSIANRDWKNWHEKREAGALPKLTVPRPGHADYAGMVKYNLDDARLVLERASARETAARVAAGAVARQFLTDHNIFVGSYITEIGGVTAEIPDLPPEELWALAAQSDLSCPNALAAERMRDAIDAARAAGDSLGGVFIINATGLPVGLGRPDRWDGRLDARLAGALMSIPAIKGLEIGPAFENARRRGTEVHDPFYPDGHGGVTRRTNRAGGLEGGMTNGAPLILRAAMKPIPTTLTPQLSVDLATGEPAITQYQRSDVCAVPAAAVVGEAMVAWVLAEAWLERYGGDSVDRE